MQVIAHRGASDIFPENTLPAISEAINCGADAVELDIRQTKDGEWICLHDTSLLRTTGINRSASSLKCSELRRLDAGRWKNHSFKGIRIPLLQEVVELAAGRTKLYLELKEKEISHQAARKLSGIIKPIHNHVVLISFHIEVLHQLSLMDAGDRYDLLLGSGIRPDQAARKWQNLMNNHRAGVGIHHSLVHHNTLSFLKSIGYKIHAFTVDTPETWSQCLAHVDAITTNKPGALIKWLNCLGHEQPD